MKKNVKIGITSALAVIGVIGAYSASAVIGDSAKATQPIANSQPAVTDVAEPTTGVLPTGAVETPTPTTEPTKAAAKKKSPVPTVKPKAKVVKKPVITKAPVKTTKKYNNGTYKGTGVGFQPGTVVSVTVKNDKITSVRLVSTNDTPAKYKTAYGPVISRIIAGQKTSVSTVSGATYSSQGMMHAVANALSKAKK